MEEGGMKTCPVCGKSHIVMYPHLFPYKRGAKYYCCYDCMMIDESKDMNLIHQVRRERRMRKLARVKKDGTPAKRPGPKPRKADVPAPIAGGDWEKIPAPAASLKLDGAVRIETPEAKNVQVVEFPEHIDRVFPDASVEAQMPKEQIAKVGKKGFFLPAYIQGFEIVGVKGKYGIYRASEEHNYFEFQPFDGDLCMNPQDWAEQMKELKKAARVLGVEL